MTARGDTAPRVGAYPPGTQAGLLDTARVTVPTRAALRARRDRPAVTEPRFLSPDEFALLRAVCDRLLALDTDPAASPVDVAGPIDARLADGATDGWRYDVLPPDRDALRGGLAGLVETATLMHGRSFMILAPGERDGVLAAVQAGAPVGTVWQTIDARRFFEDLLAVATETFYASAAAQDEIGYVGYADAHGWHAVGLDAREGFEPEPQRP